MIKIEKNFTDCPVATTVQLIDGKWKLLILRDLLSGKKRYGELHKSIPNISQKMLTSSLKSMVEDGIVDRKSYAEIPPKVEYSLTALGKTMKPIIKSLEEWGLMYIEHTDV